VAVAASGTVYVVDSGNSRVVALSPNGTQETLSLSGVSAPVDVAVDAAGNVFVLDYDDKVVSLSAGGRVQTTLQLAAHSSKPTALGVDAAGYGYISVLYNHGNDPQIVHISPTGYRSREPLNDIRMLTDGLAVDWDGKTFVTAYDSESRHGRVVEVKSSGARTDLSIPDLGSLSDVAVDGVGSVLALDSDARRVARMTPDGDVSYLSVPGNSYPDAVAGDSSGNVIVVDTETNRVVRLPAPASGGGSGSGGGSSDGMGSAMLINGSYAIGSSIPFVTVGPNGPVLINPFAGSSGGPAFIDPTGSAGSSGSSGSAGSSGS